MKKIPAAKKASVGPSLREQHKQLTREKLLDAAVEVFNAEGFRSATVDEIASRAGANRTTFYLHFKDKVEVGRALYYRLMDIMESYYRKMGDMRLSRSDVRLWVAEMMTLRTRYAVLFEVPHEAATSDRGMSAAFMEFHLDVVKKYWAPLLQRRSAEEAEQMVIRIMLMNMMQERFLFLAPAKPPSPNMKKAMDAISDMWWERVFKDA